MKKIKLFSALALTLFMASCDDFELPNPPGQTNTDPEAYFTDADLALAPVSEAISLTAANNANQYVTVANITTLNNFPSDYELVVDMEVGSDDQFAQTTTVETVIDGNAVTVNPDILNGAIQEVLSKKPGTYTVNVRFPVYAVKGTTKLRLGGMDNYYLPEVLNVTTYDAVKVVEDMYYIVPCDASGNPDWNGALAMNNTAGNGAVGYDHPEFSLKIESPAPDGYYFKIGSQSVVTAKNASQLLGVNLSDDQGMTGKLGTSYGVGHVIITGDVLITINAELDSYAASYAFSSLYVLSNGVDPMSLYTDNYITYSGVAKVKFQWMLGGTTDKTQEPIFRQSPDTEAITSEDGLTVTGNLITDPSAKMMQAPVRTTQLYWISADLPALTYSITLINDLSLIGGFNGWDHETSVSLTPSKDLLTWTATDVELDGEFKIAANKEWKVDFGGTQNPDSEGELVYTLMGKGDNLNVEKGKYDVEVNFNAWPYVLTLKKK